MTDLDAFIAGLPKAELHMHIEGSLEPELMFALARRNRVEIPFRQRRGGAGGLQLLEPAGLPRHLLSGRRRAPRPRRISATSPPPISTAPPPTASTHAEIFFDPQTHTDRGIPFGVVMRRAARRAWRRREARHGLTSKLILCFLRHLDEEAAFATLREAEPWLDRIEAVGLDSSELGHPPEKFARVFAAAAERGLKRVAHAGEEGPPDYVWQALDLLQVDRLDHGNRVARGSRRWSQRLARGADDPDRLPALEPQALRRRRHGGASDRRGCCAQGLRATINSDDPAYFGGYVNDNYRAAAAAAASAATIWRRWRATASWGRFWAKRRRRRRSTGWRPMSRRPPDRA